ncbi:MAG: FMN-binding protein [Candidatus Eisenbacteria bacterium]|nr:FMN-binding protein [Candidatus Eisenbacteria bacterium]
MRDFLRQSWLVLACAAFFGLLLAWTYASWEPRIEQNRLMKLRRGIRSILVDADSIRTDTLAVAEAGAAPLALYTGYGPGGELVGYVFRAEGTGFQDRIELLVGVGPALERFRGIAVLFAAETPGFGDAIRDSAIFKCQFVGAPTGQDLFVVKKPDSERPKTDDPEIVSITGATITSEAVTTIINRRFDQVQPLLERFITRRAAPEEG